MNGPKWMKSLIDGVMDHMKLWLIAFLVRHMTLEISKMRYVTVRCSMLQRHEKNGWFVLWVCVLQNIRWAKNLRKTLYEKLKGFERGTDEYFTSLEILIQMNTFASQKLKTSWTLHDVDPNYFKKNIDDDVFLQNECRKYSRTYVPLVSYMSTEVCFISYTHVPCPLSPAPCSTCSTVSYPCVVCRYLKSRLWVPHHPKATPNRRPKVRPQQINRVECRPNHHTLHHQLDSPLKCVFCIWSPRRSVTVVCVWFNRVCAHVRIAMFIKRLCSAAAGAARRTTVVESVKNYIGMRAIKKNVVCRLQYDFYYFRCLFCCCFLVNGFGPTVLLLLLSSVTLFVSFWEVWI